MRVIQLLYLLLSSKAEEMCACRVCCKRRGECVCVCVCVRVSVCGRAVFFCLSLALVVCRSVLVGGETRSLGFEAVSQLWFVAALGGGGTRYMFLARTEFFCFSSSRRQTKSRSAP